MTTAFTLMKNVLTQVANSILVPLGLVAAASATYVAIQKKIFGSGTTALIISGEEIDDIINLVSSLEESGLLINGVSKVIKNEAKGQKGKLLVIILGTLGASLLGYLLKCKVVGKGGDGIISAVEGTNRAGQDF